MNAWYNVTSCLLMVINKQKDELAVLEETAKTEVLYGDNYDH